MNKQEFIEEVLWQIDGKAYLNEIKAELEDHIEDRKEYYTNAGYDSEIAEEKAVAHMGSAEDIGEEMNMLYNYKMHKIISIAGFSLLIISLPFQWGLSYMFSGIFSFVKYIAVFNLIFLAIIYRSTLYSRGRVLMLLQGIISFCMVFYMASDLLGLFDLIISYSCIAAITFFIHGIVCLTCTAEINSAIKGNQNNAIMKRYKMWEKGLYILTATCTLIRIAGLSLL
ncbi:MAG: permease prefix domain 1-containing protein [Eubacterium sp.]|nr:permease prefix domain 1-containing protein [Eubacterium sp.]